MTYPLPTIILPLAILYTKGIQQIPNPLEICRIICEAAEEATNKELAIQMKDLDTLVNEASNALKLPLDKVGGVLCVEEKLSLLQRFKLKKLIDNERTRKRVQYFSEFIKKYPECNVDSETVFQEIIEKITD